uniref:ATP-grasp domain-containing protein n=1 Tax=Zooxanthella nutricula TaxID=1333877 RepID=A0A7S2VK92_9DINO
MIGAEFVISRDPQTGVMTDDEATLLEINARFSGGIHSTLGSGFIQDYMGLLAALVGGTPSRDLPLRSQWPLVRSDGHDPQSDFLEHNPIGWSVRNLGQFATVRHMFV